jgi:hypothetical protein
MRHDTEDFLSLVRDAENPTRADEERVRQVLRTAVAAGVVASIDPSSFRSLGSASPGLSPLAGWGWKLGLVGACAAAAFGTGDTPRSGEVPRAPIAAPPSEASSAQPAETASQRGYGEQLAPAPSEPDAVPARERPARRVRPTPTRNVPEPSAPSLRAEIELLRRVQAALQQGDGETALRELDSHVTSDRTLLAERRAARILALCRVGRVSAARLAQAEFAREHPDSIQREAVESACANR